MPQFDVSTFSSQLFWLIVIFSCLYFVVSCFIAPSAENILTSRHRIADDHIAEAEEYNKQIAEVEALKAAELSEANKHAEDIRAEAIRSLNYLFANKKGEVISQIKFERAKALKEIELYINSFHTKESDSCMKLAAAIIHKLTGKDADMKLLSDIEKRLYLQTSDKALRS